MRISGFQRLWTDFPVYVDCQTVVTSANARGTRVCEARLIFICLRLAMVCMTDMTVAKEHNTG